MRGRGARSRSSGCSFNARLDWTGWCWGARCCGSWSQTHRIDTQPHCTCAAGVIPYRRRALKAEFASRTGKLALVKSGCTGLVHWLAVAVLALLSRPLCSLFLSLALLSYPLLSLSVLMHLYTHTLTHSLTLLITCTCCYDQIKGTQDKDFSYSFSDSLSVLKGIQDQELFSCSFSDSLSVPSAFSVTGVMCR